MILAGDIGGTHTRLALFDADPHEPLALATYPSRKHAGLEEIVAAFLAEHPAEVDCACFDVAGPVRNGRVKTTNLPWIVDARQVADTIGLPSVALVNDLVATAYGIAELTTEGADDQIDHLAKKYLGKDEHPWRSPTEERITVKIRPEKVDSTGFDE